MTVQFEHDERDTENNIDINKIKNLASNHNQFFRSVKKREEKVHLEFKVAFQFFVSPRQTHKLNKFKFRICPIGYSYIFKRMLFFL